MRHGIAGNRLSRNQSLRKATVRDLAKATLIQQRVCTTKAKAKEARKLIDRLITLGKKGTLAGRRRAFSVLCDHQLVSQLFNRTAPLFKERPGGYTRIIPISARRLGDNAELVYLELTEKDRVIISREKTLLAKQLKIDRANNQTTKDAADDQHKKERSAPTHSEEPPIKPKVTAPFKPLEGIRKFFNRRTEG